jgi:hypothetical protein
MTRNPVEWWEGITDEHRRAVVNLRDLVRYLRSEPRWDPAFKFYELRLIAGERVDQLVAAEQRLHELEEPHV